MTAQTEKEHVKKAENLRSKNLIAELQNSSKGPKSSAGEITGTWKELLLPALNSESSEKLREFLKAQYRAGKSIFPAKADIFKALNVTSFEQTKAVILGQDPYHGPGQADGLSFSVPKGKAIPPSLQNIFKELKSDIGCSIPSNGDLTKWAKQGVLMLNTVMTVEENRPASHQNQGWEILTDTMIRKLSEKKEFVIFVLWGAHAQKKRTLIDSQKHLVIESPHPSPLSSYRGFFNSRPFSRINSALENKGLSRIDWSLE